jgi:hypothetical protein
MNTHIADRKDVMRLFGDMPEHTLSQILRTGATTGQLETVAAWLAQDEDSYVKADLQQPLDGPCAQVVAVLEQDAEQGSDTEF